MPPAWRSYVLRGILFCSTCGSPLRGFGVVRGKRGYMDTARRRGRECPHPAMLDADAIEAQLAELLAGIKFDADWLDRALAQIGAKDNAEENERKRKQLMRRLERNKALFRDGDIEQAEYRGERDRIQRQLAAIPAVDRITRDMQAAHDMIASFGSAWKKATLEQRERMAHVILRRVLIENGSIVAIEPFPDFHPLLATVELPRARATGNAHLLGNAPIIILPPGVRR